MIVIFIYITNFCNNTNNKPLIIIMYLSNVNCAYCKVQVPGLTVVTVVTMRTIMVIMETTLMTTRVYRTPVSWTEISWKKKS